MHARRVAVAPAVIALALAGAGCGGGDDPSTAAATTPAATTPAIVATTPQAGGSGTPEPHATTGAGHTETPHAENGLSTKDSLAVQISKNPDLRTFSTAVSSAGLSTLLAHGSYTVFAPNNDAFTKLGSRLDTLLQPSGKAQLTNLLKFQIVKGKVRASQLKNGRLLTTLQGGRLRVRVQGNTTVLKNAVGTTTILVPDGRASNGIIHTIDTVLLPRD
ncbi:MAG: fasciclin domain-containing protein [Patulibacter sp.]